MPRQISLEDEALSGRARAQPVWDLPVRLFHWLLAALIAFSWWSVKYHHTDWHIWSGCAILTLLIFRILWGFAGSSTSRFASFVRGPGALRDYWSGKWSGIGHNPLGALSVIALLGTVAVQVGLGLISEDEDGLYMGPLATLVSTDTADKARDLHELWFNALLAMIALHVLAILYYRLRGKALTWPMITGKARVGPGEEPIRPGKWWVALACLLMGVAITRWIIAGAPPFGS